MAKRHKNSTRYRRKKREKEVNGFYEREKKINKLINDFVYRYKHMSYPPCEREYNIMNKIRLEIKRLFSLQDVELWKQSYRRKRFYNQQLSRFKHYYTAWKRYTYYIYLHQRYGMPLRFVEPLTFFKKISHNIYYTIFTL